MTESTRSRRLPRSLAGALALSAALALPLPGQQVQGQRGPVRFEPRLLFTDANEGAAIADVDRDGRPDIIAGRNWYPAPDFSPRPLRLIADWNGWNPGAHSMNARWDGSGIFVVPRDDETCWWFTVSPPGYRAAPAFCADFVQQRSIPLHLANP